MKKLSNNKPIDLTVNVLIFFALVFVVAVSFIPRRIAVTSGGSEIKAIYNGNRESNNVSLMFNVYQSTEEVNLILDELKAYGAKATFFVGGCWADDNMECLQRIVGEGHEIANHGYFHKDHKKLDYNDNKEEIYLTELIVSALCGKTTRLFAPPSGSFNETTLVVANDLGYKTIMWSKDTIDWRDKEESAVFLRATNNVAGGDLVLMHPYAHTRKALPRVLEYYKANNLNVVTVSENLEG